MKITNEKDEKKSQTSKADDEKKQKNAERIRENNSRDRRENEPNPSDKPTKYR